MNPDEIMTIPPVDMQINLKYSDTITKFTASYKVDDDTLSLFTQSEGYRPGGYNRGGGLGKPCLVKILQMKDIVVKEHRNILELT